MLEVVKNYDAEENNIINDTFSGDDSIREELRYKINK